MVSLSGFQVLCLILATQAAGNSFPKQAEQDDSLLKKCHAAFVLTSIANVITPLPPAQACFNSWTQYYSTLSSLASKSYTTTLTSTEIFSTYPAVPTSTFCDNIPRLLGRQYSAYVTEWYPTAAYTTWSSMTSPTPTCTVNANDCAKLQSSWNMAHTTETPIPDFPVPCTTYRACSSVPGGPCSLAGSSVKIYYWPTPATQPLCPQTNTLLPISRPAPEAATSKSPVVKVVDGLTMTSPSIYISIPTLYGQFPWTNLFTGCGSQLTSLTLSIPPSPISTLTRQSRGRRPTYENPKPFALSTLNWPVSATKICSEITQCEWNDAISTCTDMISTRCVTPTINPYDYNPALLLPTSLVNLAAKKEASYKSCVLHPAAAADATWIPITTLPGDPRYTQGWSATSTIPPTTVTAAPTPEVTST